MISFWKEPKEPQQIEAWERVKPYVPELPNWVRGPFWHTLLVPPAWEYRGQMVMMHVQDHDGREWLHVAITGKKRTPNKAEWETITNWFLPGYVVVSVIVADNDEYLNETPHTVHLWARLGEGRPVPHFPGLQTTIDIDLDR